MKNAYTSAIVLAAALVAGNAIAANPVGLTRAQVDAALVEAQRSGNVLANDETGQKLNQLYPNRYPQTEVAPTKTRAQVNEELAKAERSGNVLANVETGETLKALYPNRYRAQAEAGKTREQVAAELREAQRSGDIIASEVTGQKLNELYPQRYRSVN